MPETSSPSAIRTRSARAAAVFAVIGLLLLMPAWILWLSPPVSWDPWFLLLIAMLPLLPPLAGLLRGRPYTYAWSGFISMIYFTHGVVEAWADSDARWLGLVEVVLAVMLYLGAIFYARWRSRELRG